MNPVQLAPFAVGRAVLARNGKRAGAVGQLVAVCEPTELWPFDRYYVRFPDGERIRYVREDIDPAPALRAKTLSSSRPS